MLKEFTNSDTECARGSVQEAQSRSLSDLRRKYRPQIVGLYTVALFRHGLFAFRFAQFLHGCSANRSESRQRLFAPRLTPASRRLRLVPGALAGAGGGSPPGSG
jgi:hypothetical protein